MTRTLVGNIISGNAEFVTTDDGGQVRYGTVKFRSDNHGAVPLLWEHHPVLLGRVWYAEASQRSGVTIVAELDDVGPGFDVTGKYLSAAFVSKQRHRFAPSAGLAGVDLSGGVLEEVSVTDTPGASRLGPVAVVGHDVRYSKGGGYPHGISTLHRQVLDRAWHHHALHRHQRSLSIIDADALAAARPLPGTPKPKVEPVPQPNLTHVRAMLAGHPTADVDVPPELATATGRTHKRQNTGRILSIR